MARRISIVGSVSVSLRRSTTSAGGALVRDFMAITGSVSMVLK
jgi:hypothetical protein